MTATKPSEFAVESDVLRRRAVWCGVVFALASLLTFLNFLPPVDVRYRLRSQVVISEARLQQLRKIVQRDREALRRGELQRIQLLSVSVLDLADSDHALQIDSGDQVVLAEINALWGNRCTSQGHYNWLKSVTQLNERDLADNAAAEAVRIARWELEAAKHYQAQHAFRNALGTDAEAVVADASRSASSEVAMPAAEAASNPSPRRSFVLAGFDRAPAATTGAQGGDEGHQQTGPQTDAQPSSPFKLASNTRELDSAGQSIELQLAASVAEAESKVAAAELAWQEQLSLSSGVLQLAGVPDIYPRSSSIPLWLAASVMVLGLAAGGSAGWFQYRLQSAAAHDAAKIAEMLRHDGVPLVACCELPSEGSTSPSWIADTGRFSGHRLSQWSEWAVTFWVLLFCGRFLLDGAWRDVLISSPLAALGRLLIGMP